MKKRKNGLPVFDAKLEGKADGIIRVSLVDRPAVESDFVAYAKQERPQLYRVADEDKHLVHGVLLRADYPIYRRDEENGEYYIEFSADEIRAFSQKYLAQSRQNRVDLDHDSIEVEGVEMAQYYIKDTAKGIAPEGFDDIADGSLFAEYHVTDEELWESIKAGEFKGFSVEIVHTMKKQETNETDMAFMEKVREQLGKAVAAPAADEEKAAKYGSASTDKGAIFWEGDEDLKEGDRVWAQDDEQQEIALEDGDYKTEDGKVIAIAEGAVKEIRDAEAEAAPEEGEKAEEEKAGEKVVKARKCGLSAEDYASFGEKTQAIADAIAAKGFDNFYISDAADDYAIVESWDVENRGKFLRFALEFAEDGAVTLKDEGVEVFPVYATAEEKAALEEKWAKAEAAEKENGELKEEMARLKAETPAVQTAHEAFKAAQSSKGVYSGDNVFEQIKKALK